ncbi:MAG: hypothetical protein R2822_12360 [Spirosomataceae bacterium]
MKSFILLLCLLVSTTSLFAQSTASITHSVNQFLNTLNPDELKKTTFIFEDTLRKKWTNLPIGLVPRQESNTDRCQIKAALLSIECFLLY